MQTTEATRTWECLILANHAQTGRSTGQFQKMRPSSENNVTNSINPPSIAKAYFTHTPSLTPKPRVVWSSLIFPRSANPCGHRSHDFTLNQTTFYSRRLVRKLNCASFLERPDIRFFLLWFGRGQVLGAAAAVVALKRSLFPSAQL